MWLNGQVYVHLCKFAHWHAVLVQIKVLNLPICHISVQETVDVEIEIPRDQTGFY